MQWGDDYSRLEQQMLMPFPLTKGKTERRQEKGVNAAPKVTNGGGKADDRILYCAEYQNDSCQLHDNHGGQFFGQPALFQHIYAVCWKKSKVRARHPASSLDCPFYEH